MKISVIEGCAVSEPEILIKCKKLDSELKAVVDKLELKSHRLECRREGGKYMVSVKDVYYIESVDERTFVYCKDSVYECEQRLYKLESRLARGDFVRISKSCILNIRKLECVRPLLNGKMEACLINGEKQVINRHYLKGFKEKFGLGGHNNG